VLSGKHGARAVHAALRELRVGLYELGDRVVLRTWLQPQREDAQGVSFPNNFEGQLRGWVVSTRKKKWKSCTHMRGHDNADGGVRRVRELRNTF
jgi:hypothetical protein